MAGSRLLRGWRFFRNREDGNTRAKDFEEVAARQIELGQRLGIVSTLTPFYVLRLLLRARHFRLPRRFRR